jgi:hypothetical protein
MYTMSAWALARIVRGTLSTGAWTNPVPWVALTLLVLAALMLVEAIRAIMGPVTAPPSSKDAAPAKSALPA